MALYPRDGGLAVAYCPSDSEPSLKISFLEGAALDDPAELRKLVDGWKIGGCAATLVLPPRTYHLLLVEAPDVGAEELTEALRWRIKDMVSFDVSEAAIDFVPLPEDAYRGRSSMLYVAAMEAARSARAEDALAQAGLRLDRIDLPELALLRLHRHVGIEGPGCAFLALQPPASYLNLVSDGDLYLTRQMDADARLLTADAALAESLAGGLVLNIQRSLDYYEAQIGKPPCMKLMVAPVLDDESGLLAQLRYNLAVEVVALDLAGLLPCEPEPTPELQAQCLLAMAGALPEIQP